MLPLPTPLPYLVDSEAEVGPSTSAGPARLPGDVCRATLKGATFLPPDEYRARLRTITSSLRSADYSLEAFHADCVACFPELLAALAAWLDAEILGSHSYPTPPHGIKRPRPRSRKLWQCGAPPQVRRVASGQACGPEHS